MLIETVDWSLEIRSESTDMETARYDAGGVRHMNFRRGEPHINSSSIDAGSGLIHGGLTWESLL